MLGNLRGQELLIILLIIVLLFGAKKLPETARGLGRSLRIFKAETKGLSDDDAAPSVTTAQPADTVPPAPPLPAPPLPGQQQPGQVPGQQPAVPAPQVDQGDRPPGDR